MSAETPVACPRCAGGKEVTAARIQELMHLGHPVQDWKPSKCDYCAGVGTVPAVVAELVPPHDNNALPVNAPFATREQFLGILERLEGAPFSPYRDDAWASAACLLVAVDFEKGDLPSQLWRRAQPFLFENSLGRVLAAETAMGLLTVSEAVETAFKPDLPRAADMPARPLGLRALTWFLHHAGLWLRPDAGLDVTKLFTRHLANIADVNTRSVLMAELLVALAAICSQRVLCDDTTWSTLLEGLPAVVRVNDRNWSPRVFVIRSVCEDVLPKVPLESVGPTLVMLVNASEGDGDMTFTTDICPTLLRFAASHLGQAGIDDVFSLLLQRMRRMSVDSYPENAGFLADALARSGAASESRLRALIEGVANTGLEKCWLEVGIDLSVALGSMGSEAWSWTLFEDAVHHICNSATDKAIHFGIIQFAEGLARTSPPWKTRALHLLLTAAHTQSPAPWELAITFTHVGNAVFQQWHDPSFSNLYATLLSSSVALSRETDRAFEWLQCLVFPLEKEAQPGYRAAVGQVFDKAIETLRTLPDAAQVAASKHLAGIFSGLVSEDVYERLFPALLAFVDSLPSGDCQRTQALAHLASNSCHTGQRFDRIALSAVADRLEDVEIGPNLCKALAAFTYACDLTRRPAMRPAIDTPDVVLGITKALTAAGKVGNYRCLDDEGKNISAAQLAAKLSRVFDDFQSALPNLTAPDYESLYASIRTLPDSMWCEKDSNGQAARSYNPRVLVQSALLRRIGPIGDDEWRLGFLNDTLAELRQKRQPEHYHPTVRAILHALGSVDIGEWQKKALEKVLAFLTTSSEADDSVLRRGVVTQLVRVADLPQAARVAREITNPTIRSETLADVAVAMAASLPDSAIALLQEITSPEMRAQVASKVTGTLPLNAERAWNLLETAASDPVNLQEIAVKLLAGDTTAQVHDLLAILGWTPPATQNIDRVATVLDELVASQCITAKKRERVLSALTPTLRAAIEVAARDGAVARMVQFGLVSPEEAADLEPHTEQEAMNDDRRK